MIRPASENTRTVEAAIGRVVAVCVSRGGIPKRTLTAVRVTTGGLGGDSHAHEKHNRPERAVSLSND